MSVDWAAEHQTVIDRHDEDVRAVGLSHIWDHLISQEHSASRGMLLGIVGAVATCLRELDYAPPSPNPLAPPPSSTA